MSFELPHAIFSAFLCALLPVPILALMGTFCELTTTPGRRMRWAAAASVVLWFVWLLVCGLLTIGMPPWEDLLAGFLALVFGIVVCFTLWSLLAWGFTSSLLLALSEAREPLDSDQLMARYTDGKGVDELAYNRTQVLLAVGLARRCGEKICPNGFFALSIDAIVNSLKRFFAVSP